MRFESETDPNFYSKVIFIIETNIMQQNINIEFLSKEFNMSRSAFYKKFKSISITSPHQVVTSIKMEMALRLIVNGAKNINEVAYSIGYNEPANFTRTFKKYFGLSPKYYIMKNGIL